jgi:hypothetical protein
MPQEEVSIYVRTHDAHFLAMPPGRFERSPVCRSDEASNFDAAVSNVKSSAPAYAVNCAIEFVVMLRHVVNSVLVRGLCVASLTPLIDKTVRPLPQQVVQTRI